MSTTVTVDPTVPLGSESLKTGPQRIRAIAAALLQMLGFDGTTAQSFVAPFTNVDGNGLVTLTGDPVQALGAATAAYADRKVVYAEVTSDGTSFSCANPSTPVSGYETGTIYVIKNSSGMTNGTNAVTLQLGTGPVAPLNRANGSSIQLAGEIAIGTTYLVTFDSANFRLAEFPGGVVTEQTTFNKDVTFGATVTLHADPADGEPLEAATAQYARRNVPTPQITSQSAAVTIPATTPVPIIDVEPITIPTDSSYAIHVAYFAYITNEAGGGHGGRKYFTWVQDDSSRQFAIASDVVQNNDNAVTFGLNASGFSPVVYAAGTTVQLHLYACGDGDTGTSIITSIDIPPNLPAPQVAVTLVRSGY